MAKRDIEAQARIEGMIYALSIAKKSGIEGLEADIRRRGITKAPLKFTQKQIDEFVEYCSRNLYANMLSTFCYALHEVYGFGKDRIDRLRAYTDKMIDDVMNLDYMGEHYVRLEDYAIELNEKYNLGIDVEKIASCQAVQDESQNSNYHTGNVDRIIEELAAAGFTEASEWLGKKVS